MSVRMLSSLIMNEALILGLIFVNSRVDVRALVTSKKKPGLHLMEAVSKVA